MLEKSSITQKIEKEILALVNQSQENLYKDKEAITQNTIESALLKTRRKICFSVAMLAVTFVASLAMVLFFGTTLTLSYVLNAVVFSLNLAAFTAILYESLQNKERLRCALVLYRLKENRSQLVAQ